MAELIVTIGIEGVDPRLHDPYEVFDAIFDKVQWQNLPDNLRDIEFTSEEVEWSEWND